MANRTILALLEIPAVADILSKASWNSITGEATITQRNVPCQEQMTHFWGFFLVSSKKGKTVLHIKHKIRGEGIIFLQTQKHCRSAQWATGTRPWIRHILSVYAFAGKKKKSTFYFFWWKVDLGESVGCANHGSAEKCRGHLFTRALKELFHQ